MGLKSSVWEVLLWSLLTGLTVCCWISSLRQPEQRGNRFLPHDLEQFWWLNWFLGILHLFTFYLTTEEILTGANKNSDCVTKPPGRHSMKALILQVGRLNEVCAAEFIIQCIFIISDPYSEKKADKRGKIAPNQSFSVWTRMSALAVSARAIKLISILITLCFVFCMINGVLITSWDNIYTQSMHTAAERKTSLERHFLSLTFTLIKAKSLRFKCGHN